MSEETKVVTKKLNKKLLIALVALLAVILIAVFTTVASKSAGAQKLEEQLSLGDKYLSELNYEQAIASYLKVIEIDSKNADAYLNLADAYVAQGEYEYAIEVLENALNELTGDALLAVEKKLEEVKILKANEEITPVPTTTPIVTSTPVPTATSTPVPTVTVVNRPKPEVVFTSEGAMCTYDFNDFDSSIYYGMTYDIDKNGTINTKHDAQWSEAMFLFPTVIDMNYCNKIIVRVKSEDGPVMIKFYDEEKFLAFDGWEIFSADYCYGSGVIAYEINTSTDKEVAGIGIMSQADYGNVRASVYDISFYLDEDYAEKLLADDIGYTFNFNNMEYYTSYGVEYEIKEDASIDMKFEHQYSEIMFRIPESINIEQCNRLVIKTKCEASPITVKFYGEDNFENGSELFAFWECRRDFGNNVLIPIHLNQLIGNVGGIGIMNLRDYDNLEATVYSITFYMDPEYTTETVGNKPIVDAENLKVVVEDSRTASITISGIEVQDSYVTNLSTSFENEREYHWGVTMYSEAGTYEVSTSSWAWEPGRNEETAIEYMQHSTWYYDGDSYKYIGAAEMSYTSDSITWSFSIPEEYSFDFSDVVTYEVDIECAGQM